MKFVKWLTIVAASVVGLLIVIAMLLPEEYVERVREGRGRQEAARSGSTRSSGSATSQPETSPVKSAPTLTSAQRNAVRSAESYLRISGFSRQGLIDQLSSDAGDRYSVGDATIAVDSLSVDWNTQAARSAVSYLKISGFSCRGLIDQLSAQAGDKYTVAQATYGATQAGIC